MRSHLRIFVYGWLKNFLFLIGCSFCLHNFVALLSRSSGHSREKNGLLSNYFILIDAGAAMHFYRLFLNVGFLLPSIYSAGSLSRSIEVILQRSSLNSPIPRSDSIASGVRWKRFFFCTAALGLDRRGMVGSLRSLIAYSLPRIRRRECNLSCPVPLCNEFGIVLNHSRIVERESNRFNENWYLPNVCK